MSRRTTPAQPLNRRGAVARTARALTGGAVTAGLLLAGLTACSGGGADPTSSGTPGATSTSTPAAVDAKYPDAESLAAALEAALAEGGTAKVVTVGTSNSGSKGTGEGTVRFGREFGLDVTTGGTIPKVRVLAVGERIFARPAQKVDGKAWVRLDDADPRNETAALFGPLASAMITSIDATSTVDSVRVAKTFEPLGEQELEGASFGAYRVTLDKEAVVASMPEEARERAQKELFQASLVYTVHLDDQDRLRRVQIESELNGIPSSQVTDYTEWGVGASYQAPPANQVAQLKGTGGRGLEDLSSPGDG